MNKLTSARTLREIADLIAGSCRADDRSCASRTPLQPPALRRPRLPRRAGAKSPSERTGYEADMLDLDAGIESDLGIDSIKRVEILTALQQRSPPPSRPRSKP